MADLTKGSGKEVALVQLKDGRHVMVLGDASSVSARGLEATWCQAAEHSSTYTSERGIVSQSRPARSWPGVFQAIGDVPALKRLGQTTSTVIATNGKYRVLDIADFGG